MAYNLRLYSEFTDYEGDTWRVNIYQDSYGGSSSSFTLGADGFILTYEGDNQSRYQPIIGSSVEIPFTETTAAHTNFLNAIATSAEGDFTVGIFRDPDGANTLYWGGVLLGDQCVLVDEAMPRRVQLKAADDLGNLKEVLYNNAGAGYGGHDTVPEHLIIALSLVRHSHLWTSATVMLKYVDDFYPENAPTASNYLSQVTVYHNGFYNPDEDGVNQFLPTYTILESFATAFNARIFQANGTYWFLPIGAQQYDDTINYYTVTKGGTISGSSTSLATALTIDGDAIKLRGYEHSFLPPLKSVTRTQNYSGNIPRIFDDLHIKAEFGTTLSDADFDFDQDSLFRLTGTFRCTQPGDNTTTGNTRLRRFRLRFTLKVGNYYLKRLATFSGTAYEFHMEAGEVLTYTPHTYGATSWELSATYYEVITPYYDVNRGLTGETTMVLPLDFITPELTAASNGMDLTLAISNVSDTGSISAVTNVDTNYNVQLLRVDQIDEDETNGDEVTYTATGLSSSRVAYEQAKVYVGDAVSTSSLGVLRVVDAPDLPLATGWQSLNYTSTAIGIHLLGVREVLGGQRVQTRTQRGTFYKGPIEMYNLLSDDGDLYLPFQLTFYANRRQVEVESFFVARDLTGITSDDGGRRNVNPPVDGYPGNPDGGLLNQFSVALNNAAQVGADVLAVDSKVELIYKTFQPVGDDYGSTKITYEQDKTDGMSVELTSSSIVLASASGNSTVNLSENSPGIFEVYLQDNNTPTAAQQLVMYATADKLKQGLVGINTDAPDSALHVIGQAKVEGDIVVTGTVDGVDIANLNNIATKDIPVYNNTASTITKGTIVREFGGQASTGELRITAFTSLLSSSPYKILGVLTADIASGASGYARAVGYVTGVNTNSFTVGTALYASATTAGAWTSALPTAYNSYAQLIGWVTKQNVATGEIFVRIIPATTLEELANVKDQPASVGQVLVYNGTEWAGTTQATYSSIGIPGATPPAGGFKSVWFQDSAGNMTYDEAFTYDTSTNTLEIDGTATTAGVLRLGEATNNGTNYVGIQAPASLSANTTYTLPSADGTSGQLLSTNGSGTLSWATRKATQVTGKTVGTGAWSLVSGFYEASISDSAILSTSIVDVIPDNASASVAATAGVLPRTDSSTGAVKIYATATPASTLTVTLNIFDL